MARSKEIQDLCKRLRAAGFDVNQAKNGHYNVVRPDGGKRIQIASSPSDHRSVHNIVRDLKKYMDYNDKEHREKKGKKK